NTLLTDATIRAYRAVSGQANVAHDPSLIATMGEMARDDSLEPAFRALALTLPSESDIAREIGANINPDAVFMAREGLAKAIACANADQFATLYSIHDAGDFRPDAASAGKRALRNVLLDYLSL